MDPIDHLLRDHRAIMEGIEPLRRAIPDLRTGGPGALEAALPALEAAERVVATRLLLHARKEDEALFPAIEAALGDAGPTAMMSHEHRAIDDVARYRALRRELETAGPSVAGALADTAAELLDLLDRHFDKEEVVLFPIARDVLSSATKAEIAARLESLEAAEHV
jgi:regulator of cell morphogenesis and NO signaling